MRALALGIIAICLALPAVTRADRVRYDFVAEVHTVTPEPTPVIPPPAVGEQIPGFFTYNQDSTDRTAGSSRGSWIQAAPEEMEFTISGTTYSVSDFEVWVDDDTGGFLDLFCAFLPALVSPPIEQFLVCAACDQAPPFGICSPPGPFVSTDLPGDGMTLAAFPSTGSWFTIIRFGNSFEAQLKLVSLSGATIELVPPVPSLPGLLPLLFASVLLGMSVWLARQRVRARAARSDRPR